MEHQAVVANRPRQVRAGARHLLADEAVFRGDDVVAEGILVEHVAELAVEGLPLVVADLEHAVLDAEGVVVVLAEIVLGELRRPAVEALAVEQLNPVFRVGLRDRGWRGRRLGKEHGRGGHQEGRDDRKLSSNGHHCSRTSCYLSVERNSTMSRISRGFRINPYGGIGDAGLLRSAMSALAMRRSTGGVPSSEHHVGGGLVAQRADDLVALAERQADRAEPRCDAGARLEQRLRPSGHARASCRSSPGSARRSSPSIEWQRVHSAAGLPMMI